jgi:hypothetical protein
MEEVAPEEIEIKRRTVREWQRWVARRGAASARFRQVVRQQANWTCFVCGVRLPPTAFNQTAGVEAAHILPWAEYDLDHPSNGLCLCKQHHWAFDEALLVIEWDGGAYQVVIPDEVVVGLQAIERFSVEVITNAAGPVPLSRLPVDRHFWPNPAFLTRLYQTLFEGA